MGYLGQGNETVPIYLSLHSPSFPIHLQEDKDNCLIFLAVSLLDNRSLSIILMIELFLCNKYLSFFVNHGSGQIFCVFLGCFCFFWLVPLLLILIHHFFFFLHFFVLVVFPLFWVVCLLVLVCVFFFSFSILLLVFLLLCVLLFMTYAVLTCSSFISCFFACISFDCSCCCGFSPYCSSFSSCAFLLPRPLRTLEKENNGRNIFHFVCLSGIFANMSFHRIIVYFFFRWFLSSTEHVFVSCSWPMFWWSDGFFVASYFSLFCVWVFGTQPSFGPTCLLCLHCLDVLSSFLEFFFFLVFLLLVWCFLCWVLVCFLSMLVVILGFSFLHCSVLMLLLHLMSWLLVCVCVCFLWLPFEGNHHGKSYGYGQPGGVNIFFGFSHNRGFWVKTTAVRQGDPFLKVAFFEKRKTPHLRGENGRPFSILSQETL